MPGFKHTPPIYSMTVAMIDHFLTLHLKTLIGWGHTFSVAKTWQELMVQLFPNLKNTV